MKRISDIDSNFRVNTELKKDGLSFYDIEKDPFSVYGIFKEDGKYRRLPEKVAKSISERVYHLHTNTAGGRVRFRTNSRRIAIIARMDHLGKMPHFAFSGSCGLDLYAREKNEDIYCGTFMPNLDIANGYESIMELPDDKTKDITINFPLYSDIIDLYIGIDSHAALGKAESYRRSKPIVFYGSSITQGGCASRPGNSYQSILSRQLNCDYINLGFSGAAKGEDEIADYIKDLDMSVFIMDYDHNAPSLEHLEKTHGKMFQKIREKKKDLPILILSRPKFYLDDDEKKRYAVIRRTYEIAFSAGDSNVYFLGGKSLMALAKDDGTVDNCHPNDLGFYSMAAAIGKVLKKII
jgi:hypothetical protein